MSSRATLSQPSHQAKANLINMHIAPDPVMLAAFKDMANPREDSDALSDLGDFNKLSNITPRSASCSIEPHQNVPSRERILGTMRQAPAQDPSLKNTAYAVLQDRFQADLREDETSPQNSLLTGLNIQTSQGDHEATKSSDSTIQSELEGRLPSIFLCEPRVLLLELADKNPHIRNELKALEQLFHIREERFEEQRTRDEARILKHSFAEAQKRVQKAELLRELEYTKHELKMSRAYFSSLIGAHSRGIETVGGLNRKLQMMRMEKYSYEGEIRKEKEVQNSLRSQLAATNNYAQRARNDVAALKLRNKSLEIAQIQNLLSITALRDELKQKQLVIKKVVDSAMPNTGADIHDEVEFGNTSLKRLCEPDDLDAAYSPAKKQDVGEKGECVGFETKSQDAPVMNLEKAETARLATLHLLESEVCPTSRREFRLRANFN